MRAAITKYATLIRNSAFNLGSYVLAAVAALVCIPIAFRNLGTERFGLLTLVWSLLAYAIVFDFGTGPAVARATAASLVHDQGRRIRAILKAGLMIQLALGMGALVLLVLTAGTLLDLLNIPEQFRADTRLAIYIVALTFPVLLVTQSLQAVLEGLERFDRIAFVRTPVLIATYAIPAIGAVAGWSLATIILVLCASRLLFAGVLVLLVRASLPADQVGHFKGELPHLFRYGRWLAVSGALVQVLLYIDRFLLSGMHGLNAVAQYGAPYDAASKLLLLPGSIGVAMFPALSKDAAREHEDEAHARYRIAERMVMVILIPVCAVLILLAAPLLHLWLGPQLTAEGVAAFRILVLAALLHAASIPPMILIEAFGRSDVTARYHIGEVIVYIPIAAFLIARFGVAGAAWAWVARNAVIMMWALWYARRRLEWVRAN